MKQKVTKLGGIMLLVALITSLLAVFTGSGLVAADGANPVRTLPAEVNPGDEFQVTVTFISPAANFNAIGLADVAPAGWSVSVDKTWCTPDADADNNPTPEEAEYIWYGPYAAGVGFTAVYKVQVPADATPGTYTFADGTLEYYIGEEGPYTEAITGDYQVEVEVALAKIVGETREVNCAILPGVTISLYQDDVEIGSTVSDGDGHYELAVPELGDYVVVASKCGFRNKTQTISVTEATTYTLNFVGNHGLIPNAPNMSYVLACINLWKFGIPPCNLNMSTVLVVINAWKFPTDSILVGLARDLDLPLSVFECGYGGCVYRWFANKVNDEGGIYLSDYDARVPIELLVRDFDLMTWDIADVTEALILTDEVDFIFGGPGTDCIFTQAPVCNAYATLFIGLEGGSSSMIWDEDIDNWPYVWHSLSLSTWNQMPVLHDILEAELGRAPIAYMTYIGGPGATHGLEYREACKEAFGEENFVDGGFHDYDLFATGAAPAVVSAAQAALGDPANPNYDICIFQSYPWNTAALTIALLGSDFNPPAILFGPGASQQSHPADFGAPNVEGMLSYTVAARDQTPELAQMYSDLAGQIEADWDDLNLPCDQGAYTSGEDLLDYWGQPCYVAGLEMWVQAIENAGNLDSTAVRNELAKFSETNPADTVLGDTWFTVFGGGNGGGILAYECHPGEIGQWQGGVFETVGGNDLTADFVYPMTDQWAWLG